MPTDERERAPTSDVRLPLRYRLPNPPAVFVGREAEAAQLVAAIERAPVAVVWGLAGLGKTALVLRTLLRAFPAQAARTLFLRLEPRDAGPQQRLELVRALVHACRVEGVAWDRLVGDHELLVGMAIDLAEEAGLWVVLDDLDAGSAGDLLADLARYARHSRWIATSRADPRLPELAGQSLALGRLPDHALTELARAVGGGARVAPTRAGAAGSPVGVEAMVRAAGGSPWQLHQLLRGEAVPGDDATAGLSAAETTLLARLAHLEVAAGADALARLAPEHAPDVVHALERRGLLERAGDGLRLHDLVRTRVLARPTADGRRVEITACARVLVGEADPALALEGVRLLLGVGAHDEAAAELTRLAPTLLSEGYAPRLWHLLAAVRAPALARWRLRIGVAIGAPEVLASLGALEAPSAEDGLIWCRALLAGGRHDEAARRAAGLRLELAASGDMAGVFEAGLIEARARGLLGDHAAALVLLEALPLGDARDRARKSAQAAECHAILGDFDASQRLAHALVADLGTLDAAARAEIGNELLAVLLVLGDLERALLVLATLVPPSRHGPPALREARSTLLLRALLGVSIGQMAESRDVFTQLAPLFERRSLEGLVLQHGELLRRIIAGELERFATHLARARADAEAAASPFFLRWCAIWERYWSIVDAAPCPGAAADDGALAARLGLPSATFASAHPGISASIRLLDELHAARRGATSRPSAWLGELPPIWSAVLGGMLRGFWALWEGDGARALDAIERGIDACQAHGYRTFELEQRAFACEVLLVEGRWSELAQRADELAALADQTGSERFALEAAFHRLVADEPLPAPRRLEAWVGRRAVAPMCARRARLVLGEDGVEADHVDLAIVDALRARRGDWRLHIVVGAAAERPGWGLDAFRRQVWLPDGRALELAQRPLMWQALEAIAEHGGAVSLELLARRIWAVADYHPLRDNGRIHTLVNRVRQLLEADPKRPARLLTSADGYRFGDAEPVRWLR